jgi:hypothetical protein
MSWRGWVTGYGWRYARITVMILLSCEVSIMRLMSFKIKQGLCGIIMIRVMVSWSSWAWIWRAGVSPRAHVAKTAVLVENLNCLSFLHVLLDVFVSPYIINLLAFIDIINFKLWLDKRYEKFPES